MQNGQVWTFAWYEFFPTGPVYPDLTSKCHIPPGTFVAYRAETRSNIHCKVNVGDSVYTKVTATSATTGTM